MATLPTNRTTADSAATHVDDHNELHDGHNLSETHRNHAAPHSGHETPAGAQAKADAAQAAAATDATTKANAAASTAQDALNTHMADTDVHGVDLTTVVTEADLAAYEITAQRVTVVPGGALGSTDVQGALEELVDEIGGSTTAAHVADTTNAHAASAIGVTPSGNLAADDVQEALTEIQTDVDTRATSAALTAHEADTSNVHGITDTTVLVTNSGGIASVRTLTQAAYDALTPVATTLYVIVG